MMLYVSFIKNSKQQAINETKTLSYIVLPQSSFVKDYFSLSWKAIWLTFLNFGSIWLSSVYMFSKITQKLYFTPAVKEVIVVIFITRSSCSAYTKKCCEQKATCEGAIVKSGKHCGTNPNEGTRERIWLNQTRNLPICDKQMTCIFIKLPRSILIVK